MTHCRSCSPLGCAQIRRPDRKVGEGLCPMVVASSGAGGKKQRRVSWHVTRPFFCLAAAAQLTSQIPEARKLWRSRSSCVPVPRRVGNVWTFISLKWSCVASFPLRQHVPPSHRNTSIGMNSAPLFCHDTLVNNGRRVTLLQRTHQTSRAQQNSCTFSIRSRMGFYIIHFPISTASCGSCIMRELCRSMFPVSLLMEGGIIAAAFLIKRIVYLYGNFKKEWKINFSSSALVIF